MGLGSKASVFWALLAGIATSTQAETAAVDSEPLSEVVVSSYRVGEAARASKTDIPVLENVQAISVVTEDLLRNQGVTRLADALRNVAGMSRSSTYGFFDAYQIRGYDAAYGSIFLDGLRNGNVAGESHELAGLEQVEVIKGPASGLFGAAPLGGVVNLVSKRPRDESFLTTTLGAGSWNAIEGSVDANSKLTASGNLLGRVNVIYRDNDEFVNFSHFKRLYVAPAVTWEISPDTALTILGRYQRDITNPWAPVPAYGTLLSNPNGELPIDFSVGDDDERAFYNQRSTQVGYAFAHRVSDRLNIEQNFRYERSKDDWDNWLFAAGIIGEDQRTIGRFFYGPTHYVSNDLAVDTRANLKLETGVVKHGVLIGVDYNINRFTYTDAGLFDPSFNPIDLFNPDYSAPVIRAPDSEAGGSSRSTQTGVYIQDHLSFGSKLTVTLGGRWDRVKSDDQRDSAFSPTIGATWALTSQAALYANVAKSFTPTPSWQTSFDGSLLPPETGRNIEGGLKLVNQSGVLSGMVSLFQLTRSDVATDDPEHAFFYVVTGEQRSRGLEIAGAWQPTRDWDVRAAYTYIDAEVTKDNVIPVGTVLANVPRNNLSLWGKYTVPAGPLARLGVSFGVLHNSEKQFYEFGDRNYAIPAYTLLDAGLSYGFDKWIAQFNINNLTDKRHFPDAAGLDRVTPGEPRNWQLTVSRAF